MLMASVTSRYDTTLVSTIISFSERSMLKTHIHDKRVCHTETSQCITDPQIILLSFIAACRLSGSNGQARDLSIWTVGRLRPCLGPQAVYASLLSPLYSHSAKRLVERNWGNHHWNASLHAADSLITIVSLYKKEWFTAVPVKIIILQVPHIVFSVFQKKMKIRIENRKGNFHLYVITWRASAAGTCAVIWVVSNDYRLLTGPVTLYTSFQELQFLRIKMSEFLHGCRNTSNTSA